MRWGSGGRRQLLPAAALAFAVLALVAVVAVASEDLPLRGRRDPGAPRWSLPGLSDAVTAAIAGLLVLGVVALLVSARGSGRRPLPARRSSLRSQVVAMVLLLLVLWGVGRRAPDRGRVAAPRARAASAPATTVAPRGDGDGRVAAPARSLAPAFGLVGLAALALLVAAAVARGRAAAPVAEDDDARRRAAGAVGDALDGLFADPDPRRAILAAYGALLAGLERAGAPRRASEAPEEYVTRVLAALSVRPEPLHVLTGLFAEARFSEHPLAESDRRDALAALQEARADLAGAGASEGAIP